MRRWLTRPERIVKGASCKPQPNSESSDASQRHPLGLLLLELSFQHVLCSGDRSFHSALERAGPPLHLALGLRQSCLCACPGFPLRCGISSCSLHAKNGSDDHI